MKQTKKYTGACVVLTFPHDTQEQLYQELNRLGWWWNSKVQKWEHNEQLAVPPTDLIRIRVWAAADEVAQAAAAVIEGLEQFDLKLLERTEPYPCRPPKQAESRIYLTFQENGEQ